MKPVDKAFFRKKENYNKNDHKNRLKIDELRRAASSLHAALGHHARSIGHLDTSDKHFHLANSVKPSRGDHGFDWRRQYSHSSRMHGKVRRAFGDAQNNPAEFDDKGAKEALKKTDINLTNALNAHNGKHHANAAHHYSMAAKITAGSEEHADLHKKALAGKAYHTEKAKEHLTKLPREHAVKIWNNEKQHVQEDHSAHKHDHVKMDAEHHITKGSGSRYNLMHGYTNSELPPRHLM